MILMARGQNEVVIIEHLGRHVQNSLRATIKAPSLTRQLLLLSDLLVYLLVLNNNFFLTWASSLDIVFNSGAFAYSSSNMLQENDRDKGGEITMAKKVLLDNVDIMKTHPPACCTNLLSSKSRLGSLWVLCPNWNNDRYKVTTIHSFILELPFFNLNRSRFLSVVGVSFRQYIPVHLQHKILDQLAKQNNHKLLWERSKKKLQPLRLLHRAATRQLLVQLYWECGFPEKEN